MKFSKLASVYDEIQGAKGEPQRVRLLENLFSQLDKRTLEAVAHFTVGEVVDPQLTDKLGIGPGTIRAALVEASSKTEGELDDEVKRTGDMSEVASSQVVRPCLAATSSQASSSFVARPRRRRVCVTSTMLIHALPDV